MRAYAATILACAFAAPALNAQVFEKPAAMEANRLVIEAKQAYASIKDNLNAAAAKMPAAGYAFKAAPGIRTFGALVAHVADAQMGVCASVLGRQKTAGAAAGTTKSALVAALAASFDECDAAWNSVDGANAMQLVDVGGTQRTRLGALSSVIVHGNEEYGYMAVYLRLKGIVPPSSAKAPPAGRGGR